jgi:diaminopimelate decarboxylase
MDSLLSLFPPGSAKDDDGMLLVEGARADDLATEFGTPVLVASEGALRSRAREYVDELTSRSARSRVVFASKAFPCTGIERARVVVRGGTWAELRARDVD